MSIWQKSQRRVHCSPPMRKVASRSSQHSKMLGQPASSHTVCRPSRFTSDLSSVYSGPIRARVLIHGGLLLDGRLGVARLEAQHPSSFGCDGHVHSLSQPAPAAFPAVACRPWTSASSPSPRGRHLRRPARGRPHRGELRLLGVLPRRPLPGDGRPVDGCPGPTDSWVTLGGPRPRDLHDPARHAASRRRRSGCPALLAIQVAQVDQMSGGRVELGLGAGWFEAEHAAYGIGFPPTGERFDRLEEQLAIVTGLWARRWGSGSRFERRALPADRLAGAAEAGAAAGAGDHRRPRDEAHAGAGGPLRTEFNAASCARGRSRSSSAGSGRRARRSAATQRRSTYSSALPVCVGRDDAEVARRAAAIGRDVDSIVSDGVGGTVQQVVDTLGRYAEAGRRAVLPAGARPGRPRAPRADRVGGRAAGAVRLLLTSGGVTNPSIHASLERLLGKPVAECRALCVPTAQWGHPMCGPDSVSGSSPAARLAAPDRLWAGPRSACSS